ncbi:sensor histidine kinase [Streptosporangium sp. NPDC051022]|uniref:sensor histidine kinase n=1 Tax=Streptosporangium sp. NPDC051022 TaxID=3155752 RepID=UPI00344070F5
MDGLRPLLVQQLRLRHLILFDIVIVAPIALLTLDRVAAPPYGWVFGVVLGLTAAARRVWPLTTLAVVLVVSALGVWAHALITLFLVWGFVLYTVGTSAPMRRSLVAFAAAVVAAAALVLLSHEPNVIASAALVGLSWLTIASAWALGLAMRERRLYARRSVEQHARLAVAEERVRIARELHDVVAHSLSLIAMKSGVAAHVAAERPGEALEALGVIQTTSRGALEEMRRMVGILRSGDGSKNSPLSPVPKFADLEKLADQARAAGIRVELSLNGGDGLPGSLESTVYRIVQESLTNVIKHASPANGGPGGTFCKVVVNVKQDEVTIEVTDNGMARKAMTEKNEGHGLIGMRERALLYGGELTAGPGAYGGFRVEARLPYGS